MNNILYKKLLNRSIYDLGGRCVRQMPKFFFKEGFFGYIFSNRLEEILISLTRLIRNRLFNALNVKINNIL